MILRQQLPQYFYLMRLHKPIGILLLLWPTLWALWLAGEGLPDTKNLVVFILGVILMRSAGCVINDIADRNVDPHVKRTRARPLASAMVSLKEALILCGVLFSMAFLLALFCNVLTIKLAFVGAILAILYPFMKRYTNLPQLGLGAAFSWGVPMAFAAEAEPITFKVWFLFLTGVVWPLIYDTMYAMVDRECDKKIGVKSTAILFDDMDKVVIALLQILFITMLVMVGLMFRLHFLFYDSLIAVAILFIYQQWLIKDRDPKKCLIAFTNNNWIGLIIFAGILLSYGYPL